MPENSFENIPYAEWLETALKTLVTWPVKGICMYAILENGDMYSNYYNTSTQDKILIAGNIQQDATIETLAANKLIESQEENEED